MKKIITLCTFLFLATAMGQAQTKADKKVAETVEKLRLAMISADAASLTSLLSDNLSYGHSGGKVEGKASLIEALVSGKSDFVSIDLTNQTLTISGKTALVRHHLDAKTNDKGVPAEVHLEVLLVFQKQGKNWRLLARQAIKK